MPTKTQPAKKLRPAQAQSRRPGIESEMRPRSELQDRPGATSNGGEIIDG